MEANMVRSALLGLAVGDALGVPHEYRPRHEMERNPVTGMDGNGVWNYPPGTWSDDSSLSFCLAESLCTSYDLYDTASRFVAWKEKAYWTARGCTFGAGRSTAAAIPRLRDVSLHPAQAGLRREQDNGNGSLMRTLPIIFYIKDKAPDERAWIVSELSSLTHGHRRAQLACIFYTETALLLLKGKQIRAAYNSAAEDFSARFSEEKEFAPFSRLVAPEFPQLLLKDINSSAYVIDTLEAVLWTLLNTDSFSSAVLRAVNLGGDTDTIASLTGGLAALAYGSAAIPKEWLSVLARRDDIENLAERLAERYTGQPAG